MWVKQAGAWKPVIQAPSTKHAGTWKKHKAMWARLGAVWHQLIPPNVVVLYSTPAPAGTVRCDGFDGRPNLLGIFPRHNPALAPLQMDGSGVAHTGAAHGSSVARPTGPGPLAGASATVSFTDGALPGSPSTHTHTLAAHTHSTTGGISVQVPRVELVPTVGGDVFYPGAVIPRISAAEELLLFLRDMTADPLFLNNYLWLAATNVAAVASGGPFDHEHTGTTPHAMNLSDWASATNQLQPSGYSWAYTHRHTANHDIPGVGSGAGRDGPASVHVRALVAQAKLSFAMLPPGSVMLFLTEDYPEGWEPISYAGLLRFAEVSLDEADAHYHSGSKTSGGTVSVNTKAGTTGSKTDERVVSSHTHTFTDEHPTTVSSIPLSVVLRFAVKQ